MPQRYCQATRNDGYNSVLNIPNTMGELAKIQGPQNGGAINTKFRNYQMELYLLAVMIKFAMPWPMRPQPNPTEPYSTPWIQKVLIDQLNSKNTNLDTEPPQHRLGQTKN